MTGVPFYPPSERHIQETRYPIWGESDEEQPGLLPIRRLTDFVIFDPLNGNEMVSLDVLDTPQMGRDRDFQAFGLVRPQEEDEADCDDESDDGIEDLGERIRLTSIFYYWCSYLLETQW